MAQGTIVDRVRKDGTISRRLRWEAGVDPATGKRRHASATVRGTAKPGDPPERHAADRKRAEKELAKRVREAEADDYAPPSTMRVADYLALWLAQSDPGLAARTRGNRERAIRLHLATALGRIRLDRLSPIDVQRCYGDLGKRMRPSSVRAVHNVLRLALERAVDWGLIARNPAARATPPRAPKIRRAVWTTAQTTAFLSATAADPRFGAAWPIVAWTGLRRAELLALRWADLDLDRAILTVRRETTKTDAGRRSVLLPEAVVAALRTHRTRQRERRLAAGGWHDADVVFDRGDGRPLTESMWHDAFRSAVDRIGLPAIRPHDLRHGHATHALEAGVHPKIVQERLGHASIATTMDLYSHATVAMQAPAVAALEALFAANADGNGGQTAAISPDG